MNPTRLSDKLGDALMLSLSADPLTITGGYCKEALDRIMSNGIEAERALYDRLGKVLNDKADAHNDPDSDYSMSTLDLSTGRRYAAFTEANRVESRADPYKAIREFNHRIPPMDDVESMEEAG